MSDPTRTPLFALGVLDDLNAPVPTFVPSLWVRGDLPNDVIDKITEMANPLRIETGFDDTEEDRQGMVRLIKFMLEEAFVSSPTDNAARISVSEQDVIDLKLMGRRRVWVAYSKGIHSLGKDD